MTNMTTFSIDEQFKQAVEPLKRLPRTERFAAIERLADDFIAEYGRKPSPSALDYAADACLHEELSDPDRMKARKEEYPFLSDAQTFRRTGLNTTYNEELGAQL